LINWLSSNNTSPAQTTVDRFGMSGVGPAADSNGYVYLSTANGPLTRNTGGADYGTLTKAYPEQPNVLWWDYFTPSNQAK